MSPFQMKPKNTQHFNAKAYIDMPDKLILFGTVSTPTQDFQGEEVLLHPDVFRVKAKEFLTTPSRYTNFDLAPNRVDHGDPRSENYKVFGSRKVGTQLELKYFPEDKEFNILEADWWFDNARITGVCVIEDPQAIEYFKTGKLRGYSLGWTHVPSKRLQVQSNKNRFIDMMFDINEVTVTPRPCNPDAYDLAEVPDDVKPEYEVGEMVEYEKMPAMVKAVYAKNDEIVYDLEFIQNVKCLEPIEGVNLKRFTGSFDLASFENNVLKPILKKVVADGGYDLPTQQINNFAYTATISGKFGKDRKQGFDVELDSTGNFSVKKVKGMQKKGSISFKFSGLDKKK